MAFQVEIAPQAFEDLDSIADYIKARSSFATAEKVIQRDHGRHRFIEANARAVFCRPRI